MCWSGRRRSPRGPALRRTEPRRGQWSGGRSPSARTSAATRSAPRRPPARPRAPGPAPPAAPAGSRPRLRQVDDDLPAVRRVGQPVGQRRVDRAVDQPGQRGRGQVQRRHQLAHRPAPGAGQRAQQAVAVERGAVLGEHGRDPAGEPSLGDGQQLDQVVATPGRAVRPPRLRPGPWPHHTHRVPSRTRTPGPVGGPAVRSPSGRRPGRAGRAALRAAGDDRALGTRSRRACRRRGQRRGRGRRPAGRARRGRLRPTAGGRRGRRGSAAPRRVPSTCWSASTPVTCTERSRAPCRPARATSSPRRTRAGAAGPACVRIGASPLEQHAAALRLAGAATAAPGAGCCSAPTTSGPGRCTAPPSGCSPTSAARSSGRRWCRSGPGDPGAAARPGAAQPGRRRAAQPGGPRPRRLQPGVRPGRARPSGRAALGRPGGERPLRARRRRHRRAVRLHALVRGGRRRAPTRASSPSRSGTPGGRAPTRRSSARTPRGRLRRRPAGRRARRRPCDPLPAGRSRGWRRRTAWPSAS